MLDRAFEIRVCRRCSTAKPLNAFPLRSAETGTRQWSCKSCQRAYSSAWYVKNRSRHIANTTKNSRVNRRRMRDMARAYLRDQPCVDCGESDPDVLEFDHVRGKKAEISLLASMGLPWPTIVAEIAKCEVRCANCHRRKTVRQIGGYRLRAEQLRPGEDSNLRPAVP